MEKKQAEIVAHAILEPGLCAQDESRQKRVARAGRLERNRRIARFALAGVCVGAAIAYFTSTHLYVGVVCGGLGGWIVGWLFIRRALKQIL